MVKRYALGIDLGTTTAKAAIIDFENGVVAISGVEYPTYYPKPGWAEQDVDDWWNAVRRAIFEVMGKAKVDPSEIAGIAVSSHRESVALLDEKGNLLDRVPIWLDKRSLPQTEWIKRNFDVKEIYKKTGLIVDPTFTATKLLWYKENKPEVLRKAKVALQPKDYIVYKLTGKYTTDVTIASRTMLFDITKLEWSEDLFEAFGLQECAELFPHTSFSDEVVGETTKDAAKELSILEGIPVMGGAGDRQCEILGAGVLDSTRVEESTGTGSTTATTVDSPVLDDKMRVVVTAAAIRGKWNIEAGMSTAGAVLRWFRDQFCQGEQVLANLTRRRAYEYLDMEAEYVPPGANGLIVLPFFGGARAPRWNPYARGLILGLTVHHTRSHVFRALMEGIAFEIRKILEVLEELGVYSKELVVLGGGGKTPTWARIKANVTKRRVVIPQVLDATLIGDAILVGTGTGELSSISEGVSNLVKVRGIIDPEPRLCEVYDKYYAFYERIANLMNEIYDELAKLPEAKPEEVPWDIDRLIHLLFKLEEKD